MILGSLKGFLKDTFNSRNPLSAGEIERRTEARCKAIFIHAFMDAWDLDVARLKKCCTHYVMPDGRLMPGCSYNNLYREKDQRFFPLAEPISPAPRPLCRGRGTNGRSGEARQDPAPAGELRTVVRVDSVGPLARRRLRPGGLSPSGGEAQIRLSPSPRGAGRGSG